MKASELLQTYDTTTNRIFMRVAWVALLGIVGVLLAAGSSMGLDTVVFLWWAGGTGLVALVIQLMLWRNWMPGAVKYLTVSAVAGAVTALAFVLEGSNQHLGLWFIIPAFAAVYLDRLLTTSATGMALAGWVAVVLLHAPESGPVELPRLALVNGALILMTGGAVTVVASRFRTVYASLSASVAQEEVLERLDAVVRQAQATAGSVAATAAGLNRTSQAASLEAAQRLEPLAQELDAESRASAGAVDGVLTAMEELSRTVDQLARAAQDQARQVERSAAESGAMTRAVETVTALAAAVAGDAREATEAAGAGSAAIGRMETGMAGLAQSVETAGARLTRLSQLSDQIGQVVTTISEFTDQTNLLALNAAIEAARAGEAGRGFAVVAQEVRSLAERSGRAAAEIGGLIGEVQQEIEQSAGAVASSLRQAEASRGLSATAVQALGHIQTTVGHTTERVTIISREAEELAGRSRRVMDAMNHLAAIAEENSASAEEIAAASEQVLAATRQIGAGAHDRAAAASRLGEVARAVTGLVGELTGSARRLEQMAGELEAVTKG